MLVVMAACYLSTGYRKRSEMYVKETACMLRQVCRVTLLTRVPLYLDHHTKEMTLNHSLAFFALPIVFVTGGRG